jgi:hypothetical protein
MYKLPLQLVAGLLALIAGIFAAKNGVTMEWLGHGVLMLVGAHATRSEPIAWLCVGLASGFLSLALRGWMLVNGHQKWKRTAWPVGLTVVILLGSCSIIGWPGPPAVETLHPGETSRVEIPHSEDIKGQMLAGVRQKKAKLNGANLHKAMLAGADLRGSDLESADLSHAMLLGANLSGANLTNANFEGAMLLGVQMEGARIDGANYKNAAFLTQDQVDEACGKPKFLPEGLRAPKQC